MHNRAELYLGDDISPDFYGWVFPKGDHVAVGTGCRPEHANRSYAFLEGVKARAGAKLRGARRILLEGHPLPMSRNKKLVFGRTLLVGDAGGMVAHTSGEGIYFSMAAGRLAAADADRLLRLRRKARNPTKRYWQKRYGAMFDFLEFLENDLVHEQPQARVVHRHVPRPHVQQLTFDSYLFKDMATVKPARPYQPHVRGRGQRGHQLVAGPAHAAPDRPAERHREGSRSSRRGWRSRRACPPKKRASGWARSSR